MDPKEYKRRFENAYSLLVEAHSFFFVWRALQKKAYEPLWKGTANFWGAVIPALDQSWMLALAKIYENSAWSKNDTIISIYSLVEHQADTGRKSKAKQLLAKKKVLLKNLKTVRNRLLAHNNAKHRENPKELFKKYPIKYKEIEELFEMTEQIFHLLHPEPNHGLSMEGFNEKCGKDVELVMKKLKYYNDERLKHFQKMKNGMPFTEFPPKS
jgi:hypothetical protein